MSRAKILSQTRQALAGFQAPDLPMKIPAFPEYDDPVAEFTRQACAVGVHVYRAEAVQSLATAVREVLRVTGCHDLFWESPEIFERHGIEVRFRDPAGFGSGKLMVSHHFRGKFELPVVLNTKPYRRSTIQDIELAALSADWGLAETGTLGLQVRQGKGRTLPVLPPRILVFLRKQEIASNFSQQLERSDPSEEGSLLTLVTGPSRTADIEKTLVIGVHGPKEVHVVITGGPEARS